MSVVVAFDLDDTLFREWDYVRSGYMTVAREIASVTGANPYRLASVMMIYRPYGFEEVLRRIEGLKGSDRFSVAGMIESYRAHTPEIRLRKGAAETLEALEKAGGLLVLISDGSTRHQRAKLKALGLGRFFSGERILISEETGGDKTTDVPWNLVRERFGEPGSRFFYIGDNLSKDFRLPGMKGWTTVMLRDKERTNVFPQRPDDWAPEYRARLTIDNITDITDIVKPCLQL